MKTRIIIKLLKTEMKRKSLKEVRGKKTRKYRKTENDRIFSVENNAIWKITEQHLKH